MGFSRYCPSSLDLTNFVVRRCRGGVAEVPRRCRGRCAGRPRPGPGLGLGIWKSGNLEIWKLGIRKISNIKILKIKIRVAQNVGKVWISRKKKPRPHLGQFQANFCVGRKTQKKYHAFAYFPWWANGPYSPGLGSCAGVIWILRLATSGNSSSLHGRRT